MDIQVDAVEAGQDAVEVVEADAELGGRGRGGQDGGGSGHDDGDAELHVDVGCVGGSGVEGRSVDINQEAERSTLS